MEIKESLSDFITPVDKEKIPKKKMNFKELLYKKRIKYGKYIDMGLVSDKVKFYVKDGNIIYQIDERNIDNKKDEKNDENSEGQNDLNSKYLKALYYCSELDFSVMPSKREIKLRNMLNERIEKYRALTKKNKKENKEDDKEEEKAS